MTQASLIVTRAFAARLIRSERWRVALLGLALMVSLLVVASRRVLGGVVMTEDTVFYPTVAVLLWGMLFQGAGLLALRRRARVGGAIPMWQWLLSVAVDLGVPGALLLILQLHSPRGAYTALSAPSLLLIPLVIMLSILRLRPWCSFWSGFAAGLMHFSLVSVAIRRDHIPPNHIPVLFSYGVLIWLTGAAAAVVSRMARQYVIEAVDEATAAERVNRAAALIEQDLRVARDIQIGLLPAEHPVIPGIDVAGMSRPAAQAGGDYYDWQPLPDGRLAVAIADVSGHGIGPALVTAVCRAYARASAPTSPDPSLLLRRLNQLIFEDVKGARFITMLVGVLSPSGEVEMVSAGHGPTLLFHAATRQVEWFGGDGLPLGVIEDEDYGSPRRMRLQPGDVLMLSTDGFFERARAGDGEQFGLERLMAALQENAAKSSNDIIAAVDQAVGDFAADAPQMDDMTAVVIKRQ